MKFRFGIRFRIIAIIVALIAGVFFSFGYMLKQISQRDELIRQVTENYQPSLNRLSDLQDAFEESNTIFSYWMLAEEKNETLFRQDFNSIYTEVIPAIREDLVSMSDQWVQEDQQVLQETLHTISDSLYQGLQEQITRISLGELSAPADPSELEMMLAESGILFLVSEIEQNLAFLFDKRNAEVFSIFDEISLRTEKLRTLIVLISIAFGLFFISAIVYLFYNLQLFVSGLSRNLTLLAQGRIPDNISIRKNNDFSEVDSNLNKLFDYLRTLTKIASRIGKRDFSTEFKPLSENDQLGNEIVTLQETLKKADLDERKYKKDEQDRTWASNSTAAINDILRTHTGSIEELGFEILQSIIKLTGSSVGGFFLVDQNEKINLLAAYAYDRRKFQEKQFLPGEGLIGRSYQEKESIFMTDIPDDYLQIKSGTGESKPVSLFIVPLILNQKVLAILEIASLEELEKSTISFIESISENIATSINNLQSTIHTSNLLKQTQEQAKKLLAQEEVMKENMEKLTATQEDFKSREKKLQEEIEHLKRKTRA